MLARLLHTLPCRRGLISALGVSFFFQSCLHVCVCVRLHAFVFLLFRRRHTRVSEGFGKLKSVNKSPGVAVAKASATRLQLLEGPPKDLAVEENELRRLRSQFNGSGCVSLCETLTVGDMKLRRYWVGKSR